MSGCHRELIDQPLLDQYELTKDNIYYKSEARPLQYYRDHATSIAHPTECHITDSEVKEGQEPRTLSNRRNDEVWNLTLQQAVELALTNNEVVRDDLQFLSSNNSVLANPRGTPSAFDPAIQETGVLFGNRGVVAALSDFDTRLSTRMTWGRSEVIQNSGFLNLNQGDELTDETGAFSTRLEKTLANSGTISFQQDWNYSLNNVPAFSKVFPSVFSGFLQAEYRQPLGAGAGVEFTRIAGPITNTLTGVSGVSQGVVISRINNDIALTQFESNVQSLVKGVEDLYWSLYLGYQVYQAEIDAMEDAVRNLEKVNIRIETGDLQPVAEQQAISNYLDSKIRVTGSLADIYQREVRLRRLLGLHVNDGKIIRPSDEPTIAEFVPDWHLSLAEALNRRVELRRQKWDLKSLEKQLWAARSLTKPRVDGVVNYRVNGFGDKLLGDGAGGSPSAFESLTDNNQTSWTVGIDVSLPFGFRAARAQVRNYELQLLKARKVLSTSEQEISYELANSFGELERWKTLANANIQRQENAETQIQKIQLEFESSSQTRDAGAVDLLQRAKQELRNIKIAYYESLIRYNNAITEIHFRKGTLLDHNNVHLQEGLWSPAAYDDAIRRAWERSYADDAPKLRVEPIGFVGRYGHPDPIPEIAPAHRIPTLNAPESDQDNLAPSEDLEPPPEEDGPAIQDPTPEDLPSPEAPPAKDVGDPVARPFAPERKNVTRRDTSLQRIGYTESADSSGSAGRVRLSSPKPQPKTQRSAPKKATGSPRPGQLQQSAQPQRSVQRSLQIPTQRALPPASVITPTASKPWKSVARKPAARKLTTAVVSPQAARPKPQPSPIRKAVPASASVPVPKRKTAKNVEPNWDDLN